MAERRKKLDEAVGEIEESGEHAGKAFNLLVGAVTLLAPTGLHAAAHEKVEGIGGLLRAGADAFPLTAGLAVVVLAVYRRWFGTAWAYVFLGAGVLAVAMWIAAHLGFTYDAPPCASLRGSNFVVTYIGQTLCRMWTTCGWYTMAAAAFGGFWCGRSAHKLLNL